MRKHDGISTVGMILGVLVIVVLAYLVLPSMLNPEKRHHERAISDMQTIQQALESFKTDNGFYPSDDQGLQALVKEPTIAPIPQNWSQYMKEIPLDPWDHAYQYENINGHLRLWSLGPPTENNDGSTVIEVPAVEQAPAQ